MGEQTIVDNEPPGQESQPELPVEEDDLAAAYQAAKTFLQQNQAFNALPQQIKDAILNFAAMAIFLAALMQDQAVSSIVIGAVVGNAEGQYSGGVITIRTELANAVVNGSPGALRDFYKVLSHEMGHAFAAVHASIDESTRETYIDSYIAMEAVSVISNLLTWHLGLINGIDVSTDGAGDTNGTYKEMYVDFLADGDMDALIGAIKAHMFAHSTYPAYYGGYYDAQHPPQNP